MILVCGAGGNIGSRVIGALRRSSISIRALVRRMPDGSPGAASDVEYVSADLSDRKTLPPVFDGVKTLFLLLPIGEEQKTIELNALDAAIEAGVRRIVKLSVLGASPDSGNTFGRIHGLVEEHIRSSPCRWVFLRPNMLMQNLAWYRGALTKGTLPLPLDSASVSHVDAEDVAAAAASALVTQQYDGGAFDLTGPESLTGESVASTISLVCGIQVDYQPVTIADFAAELRKKGDSDWLTNAECELFAELGNGAGSVVTSSCKQLTGREAGSLAAYAERELRPLLRSE